MSLMLALRKLPTSPNKFRNNLMKQYYMNIEKNYRSLELCNAILETIKKIISPGNIESARFGRNILKIFERWCRSLIVERIRTQKHYFSAKLQ